MTYESIRKEPIGWETHEEFGQALKNVRAHINALKAGKAPLTRTATKRALTKALRAIEELKHQMDEEVFVAWPDKSVKELASLYF
jgi:hypothetical protein